MAAPPWSDLVAEETMMKEAERIDHQVWPQRALLLLGLGALAGLAVHFLTWDSGRTTEDSVRLGAAAFVAVGGIVFAFSLERLRWTWSAGFALVAGLVVGLITLWNGSPDIWGPGEGWRFAASLLAVGLAVPLFQAMRDSGRRSFPPRIVHEHVWINVVLWFLAWAFVLAVWLLANMLAALFDLIGLEFLERLLRKEWFPPILFGGALGAAVGMLRDRDSVLALLQKVGRTILSVLAPALAVGLLVFVLALPFTGLEPLWRETKDTTPILLACMFGAFVLANAVIGHSGEEEAKARPLRWAAMALGAVMLPLATVAAVSMGKRVGQYGFTPDRLWALVIVSVAAAVAFVYLLALLRRRADWTANIRRYNVHLAAGVCLLALFLALPIVNFGAISARDQVRMLDSGKVTPEEFDWRAMRFDFGPSGRAALERLARMGRSPDIKRRAALALRETDRWKMADSGEAGRARRALAAVRVLPRPVALPIGLSDMLAADRDCAEQGLCLVFYEPDASSAIVVTPSDCIGKDEDDWRVRNTGCDPEVTTLYEKGGKWVSGEIDIASRPRPEPSGEVDPKRTMARAIADFEAMKRNRAEVRPVTLRQVFVDGRPVDEPFE
jgi:hypothetical protein